jgi:hypothetical protein
VRGDQGVEGDRAAPASSTMPAADAFSDIKRAVNCYRCTAWGCAVPVPAGDTAPHMLPCACHTSQARLVGMLAIPSTSTGLPDLNKGKERCCCTAG